MALQDRQPLDVWATVLLLVVPLIALLARIYVRVTKKTFGLDDSLIVVGAFFYVLQCTTVIGGAVHGLGLQTDHITSDAIYIQAGQWFYFNVLAYSIAAAIVRLSVLVTLIRLVSAPSYQYSIYVAMFAIIAVAIQGVIFLLVQCKPISWYWNKSSGSGSCVSSTAISANTIVTTFIPAVTDVFSAVLPVFLLWNVQMNFRTKILVCIMLGLGALASICIIVRLPAIVDLQNHETSLYSVAVSIIWGTAEVGIGITASCASTLRPLFRSFIGSSRDHSATINSYSRGTLPISGSNGGHGHRHPFRSTVRTAGMTKLSDPSGTVLSWKGDDSNSNKNKNNDPLYDLELDDMKNLKGFKTKTTTRIAAPGSGIGLSGDNNTTSHYSQEASEDLHGDSNSETEILEEQYRQRGIRIEKGFTIESTKAGS